MQVDIMVSGGIRVFPVDNNNNENDIYNKNKNVNMPYTMATTSLIISIAISNYSLMVVRQSFKKIISIYSMNPNSNTLVESVKQEK